MPPLPRAPRVATLADVPEIVRVTNAAYRVEDFFIDGDRTCDAEVSGKIIKPGCCFLVVAVLFGTGLAASVYFEGPRARARGCRAVEIDVVNLREELPAFYARMGFTVIGDAPFLKGHKLKKPVHLILMETAL